jgi:peptidoglycan DL-endopeptidase CwlO
MAESGPREVRGAGVSRRSPPYRGRGPNRQWGVPVVNGRRLALVLALVAALLVPIVVVGVQPAGAVPLATKKARAKAQAEKIRTQLAALDATLGRAVEDYNLARIKLAAAEERVSRVTRELKVARYELKAAIQTLQDRVVGLYKQRPVDFLDVIFRSRNFDDLATDLKAVREISMQDSDVVDKVEKYESLVIEKRKRLVTDRRTARVLLAECDERQQGIEAQIGARKDLLRGVEKEIARIEKQEREAARRAAAAAAAAAASSGYAWRNPRMIVADAGPGHPEVIEIAKRYLGIPYVYAAADPNVGFDCSGLVMYCYAQIGISLPHYSGYQQNMGKPVAMTALIPGDLVFKGYPVSYHVGLYAGGGTVIEAPHTGDVVKFNTVVGWEYAVRL